MTVRRATEADRETVLRLWREFAAERPPADYYPVDWDQEVAEIDAILREEIALLAERDGDAIGLALARRKGPRLGELTDLYVRPAARREGVAKALVRAAAVALRGLGVDHVNLHVGADNATARAVYERLGFREESLYLVTEIGALEARLAEPSGGRSFGSIHVQTDDRAAVERTVAKVVPRLGRSAGTAVSEARSGWVAVYDELCDREPKLLQRLAKELSYASAAVVVALGVEEGQVVRYTAFDRGGAVDEYLSVPEFYGPLPPGDIVALGANPTVLARLTGADPARVRAVARSAASPAELSPAAELVAQIGAVLGLEGAEHGYEP